LKLKLGIRVSPRTVGKYLAQGPRQPDPGQRWLTFVRNHAQAIVACDFFVVVTARFRILYVLVLMELGRRRILHANGEDHPSAEWTQQQWPRFIPHRPDQIIDTTFREVIECIANPCWADCIMSTGWKRSQHEHEWSLCAPQVCAKNEKDRIHVVNSLKRVTAHPDMYPPKTA
jgi:hypothetical protein